MRLWRNPVAMALVVVALIMGACDSEGDGAPDAEGGEDFAVYESNGVSFEYPSDWDVFEELTTTAEAGNLQWQEGVGADTTNLILISEYLLNVEITDDNVEQLEGEIVTAIGGLVEQAGGTVEGEPEQTTVGGLPAYTFAASGITTVDDATVSSRFILVFDGDAEYFLNCQYEDDHEQEILDGCDQAVATFTVG